MISSYFKGIYGGLSILDFSRFLNEDRKKQSGKLRKVSNLLVIAKKKNEDATVESRSRQFLLQRISVVIQRHNAGCVMGTFTEGKALDEIFLLF